VLALLSMAIEGGVKVSLRFACSAVNALSVYMIFTLYV
jgi:hypothetical protein